MEYGIRLLILLLIWWATTITATLPASAKKQLVRPEATTTIKIKNEKRTLHNARWFKYKCIFETKARPKFYYRASNRQIVWLAMPQKSSLGPVLPSRLHIKSTLAHKVQRELLPTALEPDLIHSTPVDIMLPAIDNASRPLSIYAKPFNHRDKRPRVGIVVTGLGLSDAATEAAIQALPGGVTLAFSPYSSKLDSWIKLARASGHEVLLNIPMEPNNYPAYDPGPQTLLTSLGTNDNLNRLYFALNRAIGYVGVVDFFGSRFTGSRRHMLPVLNAINQRGLLYLDSGSSPSSVAPALARGLNMTFATATLTLDDWASRKNIDRNFAELEKRAKSEKQAIGIGSPYPVTLEKISNWAIRLRARGLVLAPISALSQKKTKFENQ